MIVGSTGVTARTTRSTIPPSLAWVLRLATWNVNSLKARLPRVEEWLAADAKSPGAGTAGITLVRVVLFSGAAAETYIAHQRFSAD